MRTSVRMGRHRQHVPGVRTTTQTVEMLGEGSSQVTGTGADSRLGGLSLSPGTTARAPHPICRQSA